MVVAFLRRCLTYPYLRRWDLARRVLRDGALILGQKRHMLRCLLRVSKQPSDRPRPRIQQCGAKPCMAACLQTRAILRRTESHYLLNRLFLDDLCVYVQHLTDADVAALCKHYRAAAGAVSKGDVGLDLERVERLARDGERARSIWQTIQQRLWL